MFFKLLLFMVFCRQSICYPPKLCSVKCLTETYCGITDTGAYTCLPCPEGNLCPGDGYTYPSPQLNNNKIFSSLGGAYIVSHINKGGERYLKRLRRIVKIAKVGLKIAIIAKTGGVAALKKAAAAKAKEYAIKKGLQCLKNGLSNFCKGKKKIMMKPKTKSNSRISRLKPKAKISNVKPKAKLSKFQPRTKSTPKKNNLGKKVKPSQSKRPQSKRPQSKRPVTNNQPCTNMFDRIANRVNNATRNIIKIPVNKGRDWLKRNVGGNSPTCVVRIPTIRPSNLRGASKKKTISPTTTDDDNSITGSNTPTSRPSKNRRIPVQRPINNTTRRQRQRQSRKGRPLTHISTSRPVTNDDSVPTSRPTSRIVKTRRIPTFTNDDSVPSPNPTNRNGLRPTSMPFNNDDSVTTTRPSKNRIPKNTLLPRIKTLRPRTRISTIRPSTNPTTRPSTRIPTIRPSANPTTRPSTRISTTRPSANPTIRPSSNPTVRPSTRIPTAKPSANPTVRPSSIPTRVPSAGSPTMIPISWAMFSSAPTVFSNIPPTSLPTFSMFSLITSVPTSARPISKPTPSPSMIKIVATSQTRNPTSLRPTTNPTPAPSATPSFITPSQVPSTNFPSQATIGLNSGTITNKGSTSTSTVMIASVVACIVIILIMIGIVAYCMNKNKAKMSPYDIWNNYYSEKKVPAQTKPQSIVNEDMHHFYSKNQRTSINPNPVFTPHLSANPSYRNSQLGGQLGSQRNSIRISIPNRKPQTNYAL